MTSAPSNPSGIFDNSSQANPPKAESRKTVIMDTFRTTLNIAKEAVDGIPPVGLKAAIGGVLAVIETFEVR